MMQHNLPLAKRNLISLAAAIALVLTAILLLLVPALHQKHTLEQQLPALRDQLATLSRAATLKATLDARLAELAALPVPSREETRPLATEQTDQPLLDIREMASQTQVDTLSIQPMLEELDNKTKAMLIHATFQGQTVDLHELLRRILLLPYADHLQSLELTPEGGAARLAIALAISIRR